MYCHVDPLSRRAVRSSNICTVKSSEAAREGPSELMVALTVAFHSELPIGSEIVTAS